MKVVYIHQFFGTPNDACGTRSYEFARKLINNGHEVTMIAATPEWVISRDASKTRFIETDVDGIRLLQSDHSYSTKQSFATRILNFLRFAFFATRIARAENGVDIVFATSTPLTVAIPGILAARRHGVPFVFEVRDMWPDGPKKTHGMNPILFWLSKQLELWAYSKSSRIIVLAPGCKDDIVKTGFPAERVDFIPNSADLDLFYPSPTKNNKKEITLIFTGAHGVANGLEAVINTAVELKRRNEGNIRFLLIGNGGEKKRLSELSRRLDLENVEFRDSVPKLELAKIIREVDAGMMILKNLPHFYYGTSPNKFFDYLAAGIPILVNYPGWMASIVEEEKCGVAVPPDDPKAFADAVVYLRNHPEDRIELGVRARKAAETLFDRKIMASRFSDLLEDVHSKNA